MEDSGKTNLIELKKRSWYPWGVFAGVFITEWLGKSTDAGNLGRDLALLAIPVMASLILLVGFLKPEVADKTED